MNKYRNKKTVIDGITFDSRKESLRWLQLKALESVGTIKDLKRQVRYQFEVDGKLIRHVKSNRPLQYVADFTYFNLLDVLVVEDVKGVLTPEYKIKAALMKYINNIEIREI